MKGGMSLRRGSRREEWKMVEVVRCQPDGAVATTTTKAIILKDHPVHHHRGCLTGCCPKDFALKKGTKYTCLVP